MARINFDVNNIYTRVEWEKLNSEVKNEMFRTFSKHGLAPSDYCVFSDELNAISCHTAKGLLVSAWTLAQHHWLDDRSLIPVEKWNLIKFASCVVASGFAELRDGGIYIKGSEDQFKWLEQKRDAGRKGGLAKQANLKKRDDIETKKVPNLGSDDVPWPNEQDQKLSTNQDDTTYQDDELSTFGQYDNGYQNQNPSNASQNPSNASQSSSSASPPLENFYPPTPTLSPPLARSPFLKGRKKINKKKKNQRRRLNENNLYDSEPSVPTQSNTKEASATSASHFDNACYKFKEKFGMYGVTIGAKAQSRYAQLLASGVTSEQVLVMIDNYANYIIPEIKPNYSPHKRSFETFIGTKGKWHCVEHLEPIQQMSQSEKTLKEIYDLENKYKKNESQPKVEDWRELEKQSAKTKRSNGNLTSAGDLVPKLFR